MSGRALAISASARGMAEDSSSSRQVKKTTKTYVYKTDSSGNVTTHTDVQVSGSSSSESSAMRRYAEQIRVLQEDLESEMQLRRRVEHEKQQFQMQIISLSERLTEAESGSESQLEINRKLLEAQVKDIQARVDEAQANALKGGKKAMTRMDTRIRELESELDAESRRSSDAQKNLRKSERKIKELTYQQDEDRKNHERMQALIDQLQGKIKSYKKQIEEAEEIAALNLAKYRQAANNVAGAQERADVNEQALAKAKARSRASSLAPM